MVETIVHEGRLFAIIISHRYDKPGISFVTPNELSQQLAYMHHPAGKIIEPHDRCRIREHKALPANVGDLSF
jgi:hypothetical protein